MSIARTVEDVRRLAPTAGFYWVRGPRWRVIEMNNRSGERLWWPAGTTPPWRDDALVNHQIIGPIEEP